MPPPWFRKCPKGIHKIVKTSVVNTQTKRNSTRCIPRRYPSYGALNGEGPSACCFESKSSRGARLYVNYLKSILIPSHQMEFLRSLVNSLDLSLSLPRDKIRKIQSKCQDLLNTPITTVRELSKLLGLLSSYIQTVFLSPLHYRYLQQAKNSVHRFRQSYEALVHLDSGSLQEVQWWKDNLVAWNGKALFQQPTDLVIETDASRQGWGGYCQGCRQEADGSPKRLHTISIA